MVRMIKRLLPLMVSMMMLSGCATVRQTAFDVSAENIENVDAMRKLSKECISVWPIQSGFIEGWGLDGLPHEAVEIMDELDQLVEQEEHSDNDLGYFLGLKARLLILFASDMIDLLPLIF